MTFPLINTPTNTHTHIQTQTHTHKHTHTNTSTHTHTHTWMSYLHPAVSMCKKMQVHLARLGIFVYIAILSQNLLIGKDNDF